LTTINAIDSSLQEYSVVSSFSKSYTQHLEQVLILSDGKKNVQVTGNIDLKTLRYINVERKEIPIEVTYPLFIQNTIPVAIYPAVVK